MKGISDFRWFGWCSLAIVVGYFIVGLWPFAFRPPNRVSWLADRAGLHFQTSGVAYDPESLPARGLTNQAANLTVEIWAEADHEPGDNVYNLLTIHNPRLPSDFVLCQWQDAILLRATIEHPSRSRRINEVGIEHALLARKTRFFTIRGDGAGTDFFLDGVAAQHFPQFVLKPENFDGQLILGNDDTGKHPWAGRLFGLAIYD